MVELGEDFGSKGVAGAGLGLGIAGTALGLLQNGSFNGILGGCNNGNEHTRYISRYEADQAARIAELETEVKLRDANTYTDSKILEMYRYVDGKFNGVEAQICQQAVVNTQITANLACLQNTVATLSGLTKTVIPIDNVCPAPMPQYNSWTAPTAGA